jgi:uncharacterized protein (TIGR02001 family)
MLTSVRSLLAATVLAGTALAATPAFAEDEAATPEFTVTGSVGLVSDYRFRGVSLSGGDAAIQGGFTINHSSGAYIGTWGSSLADTPTYGETEVDIFVGWKGEVTPGLTLDAGLTYYTYPGKDEPPLAGPSDYFEPYVKLSTTLGPVGATVGVAYVWDQDSMASQDNLYLFTDLSMGIPDTPITLSAHLGFTDGPLAPEFLLGGTDKSAIDYSIGASATVLGGLTIGVNYVGSQGPNVNDFTDDAVVGTLTFAF